MPRRRSGLAASSERKYEDALAKRVERWSRAGALPHALAIQLKSWVDAERCGALLGRVTAFRASCGRMPRRKHIGDDEDHLARRLKRYCESASLDAYDASAYDEDPISARDDEFSSYCSKQLISDCGRLSSMVTDVHRARICPRVRRMFDIVSMNMRTAGSAGEWRFVLMICVAAGHRSLNDFGTADLTPLTQLSFSDSIRKSLPRVSAFARCFLTLEAGFHLGLRSIRAYDSVDEMMLQSFVDYTGLNQDSVRWAWSEIYSVSRHALSGTYLRHSPAPKRTCLREISTRATAEIAMPLTRR